MGPVLVFRKIKETMGDQNSYSPTDRVGSGFCRSLPGFCGDSGKVATIAYTVTQALCSF